MSACNKWDTLMRWVADLNVGLFRLTWLSRQQVISEYDLMGCFFSFIFFLLLTVTKIIVANEQRTVL